MTSIFHKALVKPLSLNSAKLPHPPPLQFPDIDITHHIMWAIVETCLAAGHCISGDSQEEA